MDESADSTIIVIQRRGRSPSSSFIRLQLQIHRCAPS